MLVETPNISFNVENMDRSDELFDVCVVGAGLVGSAAARHCSSISGLNVILIGPNEPQPGEVNREIYGCHYDEGRITRIYDPVPETQILNTQAISRYNEIAATSGISFYKPVGCLYYGEKGNKMIDNVSKAKTLLIDVTEDLSKSHPMLKLQSDELAFLEPSPAGIINPRRLIEAQIKCAKMNGCQVAREVVENVQEIQDSRSDIPSTLVLKLTTSSGKSFRSRKVLLCTNAFTNFKSLLPEGKVAHMEFSKSQVALLQLSTSEAERLRTVPTLIYGRITKDGQPKPYSVYALPPLIYPDGKTYFKIGWDSPSNGNVYTLEEMVEWYRSEGFPERRDEMIAIAKELIPGLQIESVKGMTCSTTSSPSMLPYIDMVTPSLGVAICGNGNSAKSSDELGRIAANLIAKGEWVSEIPREKFQIIYNEI